MGDYFSLSYCTLQLCETAFRKNFNDYHQLSAELAKSQDSATVINVWKDYLIHVNHFLEAELPQHYHELHEHDHLCQVTFIGYMEILKYILTFSLIL